VDAGIIAAAVVMGLLSTKVLSVLLCAAAPSMGSEDDAPARYRRAYRRTQLAGMSVLTGWAVANIASGVAGAVLVKGDRRFVHEMNAMWNSVNLTLGIIGLVKNARPPSAMTRAEDPRRAYRKVLRLYAINGALDIAYITAGVVMAELGRAYAVPRVQGYGASIAFQGAFLFTFDLGMLIAHERAARRAFSRPSRLASPAAPSPTASAS
jgi:hypothetical protein